MRLDFLLFLAKLRHLAKITDQNTSIRLRLIFNALLLEALLLGAVSCLTNNDSEKKGYVEKSQFNGEWITNATTVAKQSHNSFAFTGLKCPAERVRFVITEDRLLAFKSQNNGGFEGENKEQALVAAFAIVEHKDPRKNLSWQERRYIKVDWSKNLAPHIECNGWLSAVTEASVKNNGLLDPLEPYRVRIEDDYMENTVDAIVRPDEKTCEEIGDLSCHPAEYRVKFSFLKVNENNDYEPWNYADHEKIRFGTNENGICIEEEPGCTNIRELWLYSDQRGEDICDPLKHDINECVAPSIGLNANFGFFRTTAQSYDRKSGFNRRDVKNWINRFNLWVQSFNEDQTPIPLAKRQPRKIVYYLNPGFPKLYHKAIKRVESDWNTAFLNVVAKVRDRCSLPNVRALLSRDPGLEASLKNRGITSIGPHNLNEACLKIYESTKDLDQSEVFFTGDPAQAQHVFGNLFEIKINDCNETNIASFVKTHGLDNLLAEQGLSEINDDNVEQACAVLEWVSQKLDLPRFVWQQPGDIRYNFVNGVAHPDGDLLGYGPSAVDPKTGEVISATANIYLSAIAEYATRSVLMMEDVARIKDRVKERKEPEGMDEFKEFVVASIGSMSDNGYKTLKTSFQMNNLRVAAKLNLFSNMNWSFVEHQSNKPNEIDKMLSLLSQDSTKSNRMEEFFSERSACFFQPLDNLPYDRLINELSGLSKEEKIEAMKIEIFASTLRHELGHNVGLRHNFKAKSDALNYPPNFWHVDTNDFRMQKGIDSEEMRSSSVMDYHKRFNSSFFGLGLYDYAAILLGYAQKMEVFDTKEEEFVPANFAEALSLMSYKDLPYLFSGSDANQKVEGHYLKVKDDFLRGKKSAHMQLDKIGLKPNPANLYKRSLVDYVDLKKQKLISALGAKGKNLVAVPYGFCTDGQAGRSDIFCDPFIYGASASEIIDNQIMDYELAHAIRRTSGRDNTLSVNSYVRNVYKKVYAPILKSYQKMYAAAGSNKMIFPAIHDYALGARHGLSFISEVLQSVETGQYCKNSQGNYELRKPESDCIEPIEIDNMTGKFYQSTFGDELLGSPKDVGYIYDKVLALLALIDDQAALEDEYSGWRKNTYSIGIYRTFAPQLISLFTNIYTDKWQNIAPSITVDEQKKVHIKYRDLFRMNEDIKDPKIRPSSSTGFKDYAILLSIAGLSNPIDHKLNFAKRALISNDRSENEQINGITFTDPYSGTRYHAQLSEGTLALGYHLLKDAYEFTCDGRRRFEKKGPWFVAKTDLNKINEQIDEGLKVLPTNDEKIIRLKKELRLKSRDFAEKDRILREKVRVIEKVQALSQKFVS